MIPSDGVLGLAKGDVRVVGEEDGGIRAETGVRVGVIGGIGIAGGVEERVGGVRRATGLGMNGFIFGVICIEVRKGEREGSI